MRIMSPESSIAGNNELVPEKILYPFQEEILASIQAVRQEGAGQTHIDVATGCGKTLIIANDIKDFLEENPGKRVLNLCHDSNILKQNAETISEVTGITSHGQMFGGEFQDQEQLVFATFQTMSRPLGGGRVYEAFDPKEFDYIFVDESHHGPAPTYRPVIDYFKPDFEIGASATVERRDEQDINDIFGEPVYTLKLEEAIAKGYLVQPDYHVLTDQVRHLDEFSGKPDGLSRKDVEDINGMVFVPKRDKEIVDTVTRHLEQIDNPRTLIFCASIGHTEHFSELLPSKSATLHSELSQDEQDRRLTAFRNGKIPTLLVVDMLNEGVDVPEINTVVFLRSTESKTVFFQQLGRGLRKIADKDHVTVLDFVANWDRLNTLQNLQADIRSHGQGSPRQTREMNADISFNFSPEALEAVKVIQEAREHERHMVAGPPKPSKTAEARSELQALLGIEKLPSTKIGDAEWQDFSRRIMAGDEQVAHEVVMRCLPRIYLGAKKLAESADSGELSAEDVFHFAVERIYQLIEDYDVSQKTPLSNQVSGALVSSRLRSWVTKLGYGKEDDEAPLPIECAASTADFTLETVDNEISKAGQMQLLLEAFEEKLTASEHSVLKQRYGLDGEDPKTLNEVAGLLNLSGARIQQIETHAFKTLWRLPSLKLYNEIKHDRLQPAGLSERLAPENIVEAEDLASRLSSAWGQERNSQQDATYYEALGTLALHEIQRCGLYNPVSTGWLMDRMVSREYSYGSFRVHDFNQALRGLHQDGLVGMSWRKAPDDPKGPIYEYVQLINSH